MSKVMVNCTHAKEDPERAILAFVVGNVSASADQETKVLLTIDGVWLATKGYAEGVQQEGFPSLKETLESFIRNGGEIWACGACTNPRGIGQDDLIEGAKIVTAANVVEYMASGASTLSF
ncbi:MAG: hypothetical protein C0506_02655 [Anaerolinea sp.]|nr:hypothetical protein [Anaerolinea sp.]